ncbi:MAG TPA: hypothetical protein VNI36_03495, partial [Candidatus Dormibacteraeota bacterium]|nr:hypothetical protein [Candidatus Dormibacteraeota bacterium]
AHFQTRLKIAQIGLGAQPRPRINEQSMGDVYCMPYPLSNIRSGGESDGKSGAIYIRLLALRIRKGGVIQVDLPLP